MSPFPAIIFVFYASLAGAQIWPQVALRGRQRPLLPLCEMQHIDLGCELITFLIRAEISSAMVFCT